MNPKWYDIFFSFELDGHDGAEKVLKGHRDRDPDNPTIIRLQFDMALKVKIWAEIQQTLLKQFSLLEDLFDWNIFS